MNNSPVENEPLPPAPQPAAAQPVVRIPFPFSPPRVTYIIIGITVAFYIMQVLSVALYQIDLLEYFGARSNSAVKAGQLWRLITPILLHGSITHILFNMFSLYSLGTQLERFYGLPRFLALYILAGFAGNAFSFLVGPTEMISIGASSSVFGLIAAEGVFIYQNRRILGEQSNRAIQNIIGIVAFNLIFLGLIITGLDTWAHVGGLLGGLIFGWLAGPLWTVEGIHPNFQIVDRREPREVMIGGATVVIFFGFLTLSGILFR